MVKSSKVCLLDFGLATNSQYACEFLYCGTLTYMAPEILAKQGYQGAPVDIWALGVCLFRLLTKKYPFGGKFAEALLENKHQIDFFTRIFQPLAHLRMKLPEVT